MERISRKIDSLSKRGATVYNHSRMIIKDSEFSDISTPTGPMRTYIFRPAAAGKYPGILLFSEIFQVTAPIRRTAALLAGHGFVVAVPEVFHEARTDRVRHSVRPDGSGSWQCAQNDQRTLSYDSDARAVLQFLQQHPSCTGKLRSDGDLHRRPSRLSRRDESRGARRGLFLRD